MQTTSLLFASIASFAALAAASGMYGSDTLVVSSLKELESLDGSVGVAYVGGYARAGDGGGGWFVYNATSRADVDGGIVVGSGCVENGRWVRNLEGNEDGARVEWYGCFAEENGGWVGMECGAAIRSGLKATGKVVLGRGEYVVNSTIVLDSGNVLSGESHTATNVTLPPGATYDLIQSIRYKELHGKCRWFVSEGVPTGMRVEKVGLWGNGGGGSGIRFYAKRFVVSDVLIAQFKEFGYYSECGAKGGQQITYDMPESHVGPLWVKNCSMGNFVYAGPHDGRIGSVFSACSGWHGLAFIGIEGVVSGESDVAFFHSYGSKGAGVFTNVTVQSEYIISESNQGPAVQAEAQLMVSSLLKVFQNDPQSPPPFHAPPSSLPSPALVNLYGDGSVLGSVEIALQRGGVGVFVGGKRVEMGRLEVVGGFGEEEGGVVVDGNQFTLGRGLFDNVNGTAVVLQEGVSMAKMGIGAIGCKVGLDLRQGGCVDNEIDFDSYVETNASSAIVGTFDPTTLSLRASSRSPTQFLSTSTLSSISSSLTLNSTTTTTTISFTRHLLFTPALHQCSSSFIPTTALLAPVSTHVIHTSPTQATVIALTTKPSENTQGYIAMSCDLNQ